MIKKKIRFHIWLLSKRKALIKNEDEVVTHVIAAPSTSVS